MRVPGSRYLAAILVAAGMVAFVALAVAVPYLDSEADCASCHKAEAAVFARGTHSSVSCVSCHSSSDAVGRLQFGGAVLASMRLGVGDVSASDAVRITNERCESCHDVSESVSVGAIRINHSACAANVRCVRCHDQVVHGPDQQLVTSLDMFDCLRCHTEKNQTLACDACHEGRLPRDRVRVGTFAVTHGSNWQQNHGLGSVQACVACHQPQDCAECHGSGVPHGPNFKQDHGDFALDVAADCTSCHLKSFCDSCHPLPMPHPADFKQDHAQIAADQGEAMCKRCHGGDDCQRCHIMHVHPGGAVGGDPR